MAARTNTRALDPRSRRDENAIHTRTHRAKRRSSESERATWRRDGAPTPRALGEPPSLRRKRRSTERPSERPSERPTSLRQCGSTSASASSTLTYLGESRPRGTSGSGAAFPTPKREPSNRLWASTTFVDTHARRLRPAPSSRAATAGASSAAFMRAKTSGARATVFVHVVATAASSASRSTCRETTWHVRVGCRNYLLRWK